MTDAAPVFPPLMQGMAVDGAADPFDVACQKASTKTSGEFSRT